MRYLLTLFCGVLAIGTVYAAPKCTGELKLRNSTSVSSDAITKLVGEAMAKRGVQLIDKYDEKTSVGTLDIKLRPILDPSDPGYNFYVKMAGSAQVLMGSGEKHNILNILSSAALANIPECNLPDLSQSQTQTQKHRCEGYYKLVKHKHQGFAWDDPCASKVFVSLVEVKNYGSYLGMSEKPMKDSVAIENANFQILGTDFTHKTDYNSKEDGVADKFSFKVTTENSGTIESDRFTRKEVKFYMYLPESPLYRKEGSLNQKNFEGQCDDKTLTVKVTNVYKPDQRVFCSFKRIKQ